jgi:uncharacterized protein YcbK (DUF882 family)
VIYIPRGGSNFYLSENFMTWEFRCQCCREVLVDETLINVLEELRELAGGPLHVTSGYRCPAHNKDVGGSKNSYHMKGMAADIYCETMNPKDVACCAETVQAIRGIGVYRHFTHVDVREDSAYWVSE